MTTQTTLRAADFTESIGINVHMEYTDGGYAKVSQVIADLKYLGIDHVRDGSLNAKNQGQSSYGLLAAAGIHFDMIIPGGQSISSSLALLDAFSKAYPGAITSIEGPNEVNNWPVTYNGLTGTAGAQAFEAALTSAVHADSALAGIPVYNVTSYPDIGTVADVANFHAYPIHGDQPYSYLVAGMASQGAVMPGKPMVLTESGFFTMTTSANGVDYATQAKLTLNLVMDAARLGLSQVYIYQLLDAYADPKNINQEAHYGLFDINNNPKPAAVALHNLMAILSDASGTAHTFAATTLSYTLSGLPSTGASVEFEKSSGAHDIVVWNEPKIWNGTLHQEIAAANSAVTVNLGATYANVSVYDPLSGTTAVTTLHNVSSVTLNVTDHPLIIEVGPTLTAAATTSAVSPTTTTTTTTTATTTTTPSVAPATSTSTATSATPPTPHFTPLGVSDMSHVTTHSLWH